MENTLFYGNGLNRLNSNNISWEDILNKIGNISPQYLDELPNTLIYEGIILNEWKKDKDILENEFLIKDKIATLLKTIESNNIYEMMYDLNIQHYITTNYDYAFIDEIIKRDDINLPIHEYSTEDVYSIRRLKRISNKKELKKNIWQIHGEIRKPATIMLGLDQYCGYIGKIDSYLKGRYSYKKEGKESIEVSIEEKFSQNAFNNSSWIELFFTTNIHIVGFSMDFAETDIWWLINQRARKKKSNSLKKYIQNKIYFYCDNSIDQSKKELLESLDVTVVIVELEALPNKYLNQYKKILNIIETCC